MSETYKVANKDVLDVITSRVELLRGNLIDNSNMVRGFVNINGNIISQTSSGKELSTGLIPIDYTKEYTYSVWFTSKGTESWMAYFCYDVNGDPIGSRVANTATIPDNTLQKLTWHISNIPDNAVYIRLSSRYLDPDGLAKLEEGYGTQYVSFDEKKTYDMCHIIVPMSGIVPNVNTTLGQLEIAEDTILVWRTGYKILPYTTIPLGSKGTTKQVFYNTTEDTFRVISYSSSAKRPDELLFCVMRTDASMFGGLSAKTTLSIFCPYTVDNVLWGNQVLNNTLDAFVKGVAHRGYSSTAPENTIPAYTLAKRKGFSYVECDLQFTSDGIPILLHDSTIDRTSNGTGTVSSLTLEQLLAYDFGSWKSSEYTGTQIPKFEDFILLCKKLNLHPYIEIKVTLTTAQAELLHGIVSKYGMAGNVSWIGFGYANLGKILAINPKARVGWVRSTYDAGVLSDLQALKTADNKVFLDLYHTELTLNVSEELYANNIEVEVWTVNSSSSLITAVEAGASGITTDSLNVQEILNTEA